jgi:hypothetical protein
MASHHSLRSLLLIASVLIAPVQLHAQAGTDSCAAATQSCVSSCGRFDQGDPRQPACESFCRTHAAECAVAPRSEGSGAQAPNEISSGAPVRSFSKKADVVKERQLNGRMIEAISRGSLRAIRQLIEVEGMNPTYVYAFDFNAQTRQYEGRAVRLRLTDIFNDVNELRTDEKGLDQVLTLFIELGLDVKARLPGASTFNASAPGATLDQATAAPETVASAARTAWGPSLKAMERARDRSARLRAFEIALQHGLTPNDDVDEWLFAELPQVCGRDRSQFAIQVIDLLSKYLGTSLQDDLWRAGERGPETVADVLDRLMSPGSIPRSDFERTQFAAMDVVWENCSPLSRRINRYLTQGK